NGVWAAQGGWEYNAVLIAALTALIDGGPGDLSVDGALGRDAWGPGWAVAGLATGLVASSAAIALGKRGNDTAGTPSSTTGAHVASAAHDDTAGDPVTVDS
ncbi:MAG TPA: hypothetical protein VFG74_12240, partial [Miltoncostaeaceae bacterium]|nr:hypothetical protein [Miltoncostaeaceae bacterium]